MSTLLQNIIYEVLQKNTLPTEKELESMTNDELVKLEINQNQIIQQFKNEAIFQLMNMQKRIIQLNKQITELEKYSDKELIIPEIKEPNIKETTTEQVTKQEATLERKQNPKEETTILKNTQNANTKQKKETPPKHENSKMQHQTSIQRTSTIKNPKAQTRRNPANAPIKAPVKETRKLTKTAQTPRRDTSTSKDTKEMSRHIKSSQTARAPEAPDFQRLINKFDYVHQLLTTAKKTSNKKKNELKERPPFKY